MKKELFMQKKILFFALCIFIIASCSSKSTDPSVDSGIEQGNEPEGALTSENMLWLSVLKFTNPAYKENVLATDNHLYKRVPKDESVFYACALPEPQRTPYFERFANNKLIGSSPWVYLADDYVLVDWHWISFFSHLEDKVNANYGQTILTESKWSDITGLDNEWSRTIPNDHNAIDKIYHFKVKALDDYRGDYSYKQTGWEKHLWFATLYAFYGKSDYFPDGVDESKIDSLQNLYVDCLNKILKEHPFANDEGYIYEIK